MEKPRHIGTVAQWRDTYGFIQPRENWPGGRDLFFAGADVQTQDRGRMAKYVTVSFEEGPDGPKGPRAVNVRLASQT